VAVPSPATWAAAAFVDDADLNLEIRDTENFLLAPPRCFTYRTADKSTANGSIVLYDMDAELYDPYTPAAHSTSVNNSRLAAAEPGLYAMKAHVTWAANAAGSRSLQLRKNAAGSSSGGTLILDTGTLPSAGNVGFLLVTVDVPLNANDYIELFTSQTSGGSLNVLAGAGNTFLSFRWVAKL
jgi:hypothetical protein